MEQIAYGNFRSGLPIHTVDICFSLQISTMLPRISLDCTCTTSPSQLCHQFKMIQQITLSRQTNSIHALFRCLNIQGDKSSIVPGCQLCRLPDNSPRCFLMTTDTSQKFFMSQPDSYSHYNFILHLLLHPQCNFLQSQLAQLQNILSSKEIVQCCLNLFRTIYLSRFQTSDQSSAVKSIFTTSSAS